jgi:excinuclease ABC subunit C
MQTLQEKLKLKQMPVRIEGYDISNLQGTNTVASMVVFENASPNKKHYRKFKINIDQQNDFYSMSNVIRRRFDEYRNSEDVSFAKRPNLILIDGGLGQLHKAKEVLDEIGIDIDIISLAKRDEMIYTTRSSTPIRLSKSDYALRLLQNVRDESHRFAITFQKSLRKNTLTSELNKISGIGKKTVDILLTHFKSVSKIKSASIIELMSVKDIGKKTAENIYNYFHK